MDQHPVITVEPRRGRAGKGRPPLVDSKVRDLLLTAIKAGNRLQVAARYAGLSPTTVEGWMRRGRGLDATRPSQPRYVQFVKDVEEAQAHAEVYAVTQVRRAMVDDVRSAIWFLENTSAEWRQRNVPVLPVTPVSQPSIGPVGQVVIISADQLEALGLSQLRAAREEDPDGDARAVKRARLVTDSAAD